MRKLNKKAAKMARERAIALVRSRMRLYGEDFVEAASTVASGDGPAARYVRDLNEYGPMRALTLFRRACERER